MLSISPSPTLAPAASLPAHNLLHLDPHLPTPSLSAAGHLPTAAALVRALTVDVDEFYGFCDPEKENLCLYGHPNGSWEVALLAEEVLDVLLPVISTPLPSPARCGSLVVIAKVKVSTPQANRIARHVCLRKKAVTLHEDAITSIIFFSWQCPAI